MAISEAVRDEMRQLAALYPRSRSALLPMLHLVQSEEGDVTIDGINACAEVLGITSAEVTAVSTFYTMYKRQKVGQHHIGVCINTLCGLLGGDAVYAALAERLGTTHDSPSEDSSFWLERIECQAACTHAPVSREAQTPPAARRIARRFFRPFIAHASIGTCCAIITEPMFLTSVPSVVPVVFGMLPARIGPENVVIPIDFILAELGSAVSASVCRDSQRNRNTPGPQLLRHIRILPQIKRAPKWGSDDCVGIPDAGSAVVFLRWYGPEVPRNMEP